MPAIEDIRDIINDPQTVKVVGTVSPAGQPHTAVKQSLTVNDQGELEYLELFESSESYRNITSGLWRDLPVSVTVLSARGEAYNITGRTRRILVAGRKYEERYREVLEKHGYDLAAVVTISPQAISDESPRRKFEEQERDRFFFKHLDRLVPVA
ncbi:MAG: hypothetical protein LBP55_03910 [Candidatus Adiutrix sp.]|jgi:hypothetical protein|nr:hypothetical protein [Candidatus Adiutrix sp.]